MKGTLVTKKELVSAIYWWGVAVAFGMWVSFFMSQAGETPGFLAVIFVSLGSAVAAISSWFSVALLVGGWMFGAIE